MKINPDRSKTIFSNIVDPRDLNKRHKLIDIITIAICAVVCGANSWERIEVFGQSKFDWFKGFLELPHGIPLTIHLVAFLLRSIRMNFDNHL